MIDEKKLIEILEDWKFKNEEKGYDTAKDLVQEMIYIVKEQPQVDKWIPCSERLPKESLNSVIGWDAYRDRCVFVQYFGKRWHLGNNDESVKIIAWQPLPQPYKKDQRGEVNGMVKEGNSNENT